MSFINNNHIRIFDRQRQIALKLAFTLEISVIKEDKVDEAAVEIRQVMRNNPFPNILARGLGGKEHHPFAFPYHHAFQQHQANKGFPETDTVAQQRTAVILGNRDQVFVGILLIFIEHRKEF